MSTGAPSNSVLGRRKLMETKLVKMYKDHRCLWDKVDPRYSNKVAREQAWAQLTKFYQTNLNPLANVLDVKKKIDNLKTGCKRERKKVESDPSYQPTIWYYDLLSFLKDEAANDVDIVDVAAAKNQDSAAAEQDAERRQENLSKFIDLYKDNRCLWDRNYPLYLKREESGAAYQSLLEFYRGNISRHATMDRVKKKIENLRATWRKAKLEAISKAKEGFKYYKPPLWYFDQLSFIDQGNFDELSDDDESSRSERSEPDDASSVHLREMGFIQDDDADPDVGTEGAVSYDNELVSKSEEVNDAYLEFIHLFKQHRCLWDPRDKAFYVKRECNEAYSALLQFYRSKLDPAANTLTIKKKVAQMKETWKAEADKVKKSERTIPSRVYLPKMPFYGELAFLGDVEDCEVPTMNVSNCGSDISGAVASSNGMSGFPCGVRKSKRLNNKTLKVCCCDSTLHHEGKCGRVDKEPLDDDDDGGGGDDYDNNERPLRTTHSVRSAPEMRREGTSQATSTKRMRLDPTDIRRIALKALEKISETSREEETWISVGRSMGQRLGLLSSEQRAVAVKLMNDALFYGELGKLNEHWAVVPPKAPVREHSKPQSATVLRSARK